MCVSLATVVMSLMISLALSSSPFHTMSEKWLTFAGAAIRGSPVASSALGLAYFGSSDSFVYAIDLHDGSQVWNFSAGTSVRSTPVLVEVHETLLIVGSDLGVVFALGGASGRLRWQRSVSRASVSGTLACTPDMSTVLVGSDDGHLYALSSDTGRITWNASARAKVNSPSVTPTSMSIVLFGSNDGDVVAVNATTGVVLWRFTTTSYVEAAPCVVGDVAIVGCGDGHVYALDITRGAALWDIRLPSSIRSSPQLVQDGGSVVVGCMDTHVYALTVAAGAQLWNVSLGSPVLSTPSIAPNGYLIVAGSDGIVWSLTSGGAVLWSYNLSSAPSSSTDSRPAVTPGGLAVTFETADQGLGAVTLLVPLSVSYSLSLSCVDSPNEVASPESFSASLYAFAATVVVLLVLFFVRFARSAVRQFVEKKEVISNISTSHGYGALLNDNHQMQNIA